MDVPNYEYAPNSNNVFYMVKGVKHLSEKIITTQDLHKTSK